MEKERKPAASNLVSIDAKLRKLNAWVDLLAENAQAKAVRARREKERGHGIRLSLDQLYEIADELDANQEMINRYTRRRDELNEQLLAHWGHTGIERIESPRGQTLISMQFEMGVDPDIVKKEVNAKMWPSLTATVLQAGLLVNAAQNPGIVRSAIAKALAVKRLKVAVTPPSSRRPKSGERNPEEDD